MAVVYFSDSDGLWRPNITLKAIGFSTVIKDFARQSMSIKYSFSENKFNIIRNELGHTFKYIIGIKFSNSL